jgi:hypothetical protein
VFYRKRAFETEWVWRRCRGDAFDKTVRREPLAFAADAVYGNSIGVELEVIAKKEVARKALLLMFVDVLLLAFTPMIVTPRLFFFQAKTLAPIHAAASAA